MRGPFIKDNKKRFSTWYSIERLTRLSNHVTCIVRERQLRLYGHVALLPAEDPIGFFLVEIRVAGRRGGHPQGS